MRRGTREHAYVHYWSTGSSVARNENHVARQDRKAGLKNGPNEQFKIFELIGGGFQNDDRQLASSRPVLMRNSFIDGQQGMIPGSFSGFKQLAIRFALEPSPLHRVSFVPNQAMPQIQG